MASMESLQRKGQKVYNGEPEVTHVGTLDQGEHLVVVDLKQLSSPPSFKELF